MPFAAPRVGVGLVLTIPNGAGLEVRDLDMSVDFEELDITHFGSAAPAAGETGGQEFTTQILGRVEATLTVHFDADLLSSLPGSEGTFSIEWKGAGDTSEITGTAVCTQYSPAFAVNEVMIATCTLLYTGVVTVTAAT